MKKIDYKFLFLCFLVLLASSFLLTGCTRINEKVSKDEKKNVEKEKTEEEEKEDVVVGDFSKFSDKSQEIGNIGNDVYEISKFSEESKNGFHRFSFELEGGRNLPNVAATYRPELGAIRVTFRSIEKDNSGVKYQQSYPIDEDGIVRVFHNITPNENEEIYDIGVLKSTQFLLHSEKLEDNKWKINIDVRYPGEMDIDIDTGSEEFGTEDQKIDGATSSDGARITSYSFGVEDGAFRFIWTVRGSESKPIPEVRARYNDDGEVVVTFPDLDSDYIGRDSSEVSLIGSAEKVVWNRVGKESIYRFMVKGEKKFRLSSSLSPNQVVLEIEL